jgi:hypothetical protein
MVKLGCCVKQKCLSTEQKYLCEENEINTAISPHSFKTCLKGD